MFKQSFPTIGKRKLLDVNKGSSRQETGVSKQQFIFANKTKLCQVKQVVYAISSLWKIGKNRLAAGPVWVEPFKSAN